MTAPVTVTQADREAHLRFFGGDPEYILSGQGDSLTTIKFLVEFRTQSAAASNAQIAELREALDSIDVWLSDTLSGRVQPDPATYKQWLIDAIVEARGRARTALARAKSASEAEGV